MCNVEEQFPIFGAKYNFHLEGVVDCPEFLVNFPVFEKLVSCLSENCIHLLYKIVFSG